MIKVYNKNDDIKCYGKNVFMVMDKFFSMLPKEYSELYYHNLETLSFIRSYSLNNGINSGMYDADNNIIYFTEYNTIGHEMFHVASNDMDNKIMGIDSDEPSSLLEGMTELLFIKTYNVGKEHAYHFEVIVSDILSMMPNFFKPYFIPNHNEFIKLFNNQETIVKLINDLNRYSDISDYYLRRIYLDGENVKIDKLLKQELAFTIREVLDGLIKIGYENKDKFSYLEYMDKFSYKIDGDNRLMNLFYPEYHEYVKTKVKKV